MKDWFKNLEAKAQRLVALIALISVLGTGTLAKILTSANSKMKRQHTTLQVLSAQVRTLQPAIYTGEVEIFRSKMFGLYKKSEGIYPVEIRYTDYFNEEENKTISINWVYIRVSGEMEIYNAIEYESTFYYWDWHKDRQWIYNIEKK